MAVLFRWNVCSWAELSTIDWYDIGFLFIWSRPSWWKMQSKLPCRKVIVSSPNCWFIHIICKTLDSKGRLKNSRRTLSERHSQVDFNFSNQPAALFGFDSALADAFMKSGQFHLKFKQDSVEYAFDFDVTELPEQDEAHQATYWHNHLSNPSMPWKVRVLGLEPRL